MSSMDTKVPPELLTHIFSYLSGCRRDIAACRRVCRYFHGYSSEFLITRVVFAKRLDAIHSLRDVLQHPYFHQHVTELVYDASTYQESIATDFENYEITCDEHCTRTFYDNEAMEKLGDYVQFYRRVCPHRPWRRAPNKFKKWYTRGTHSGFHDYFDRWMAQDQMDDDGLATDILQEALVRLPKLRRILFTDFREIAREGEGYSAFCRRIFGNTLEPLALSFSPDVCREFMMLMDMITKSPQTNIRSLSIGGHPFESFVNFWASNKSSHGTTLHPSDPPAVFYEPDHDLEDVESIQQACRKLHQLRLPIRFEDIGPFLASQVESGMSDSFVGKLLASSAASLVQLSLSALDLLQGSYEESLRTRAGGGCIDSLLCTMTFPALRRLELCGWPLSGQPFQEFLSKHSSNLKELCLVECVFPNHPRSLGRWAGNHMFLNGVNMKVRVEDNDRKLSKCLRPWEIRELEGLWLAGRPNTLKMNEYSDVWNSSVIHDSDTEESTESDFF